MLFDEHNDTPIYLTRLRDQKERIERFRETAIRHEQHLNEAVTLRRQIKELGEEPVA